MPWKPGQSGNPSGRPVAVQEVLKVARDGSPKAIRRLVALIDSEDERVSFQAAEAILNRAWGKPAQAVHVSGAEGGPITFTWLPPIDPEPELLPEKDEATMTDMLEAAKTD